MLDNTFFHIVHSNHFPWGTTPNSATAPEIPSAQPECPMPDDAIAGSISTSTHHDHVCDLEPGTSPSAAAQEALNTSVNEMLESDDPTAEGYEGMVALLKLLQDLCWLMGRTATTLRADALAVKITELKAAAGQIREEAFNRFCEGLSRGISQAIGGLLQGGAGMKSAVDGCRGAKKSVDGETAQKFAHCQSTKALRRAMGEQGCRDRKVGAELAEKSGTWLARSHLAEAAGGSIGTVTGATYGLYAADDAAVQKENEANAAAADHVLSEASQFEQHLKDTVRGALQTLERVLQSKNQADAAVFRPA